MVALAPWVLASSNSPLPTSLSNSPIPVFVARVPPTYPLHTVAIPRFFEFTVNEFCHPEPRILRAKGLNLCVLSLLHPLQT
jgi:hypothetical protein